MPRIPNAATSELIARTSGTIEATIAPNANSRMMNVSGIVSDRVESSPLLMSALMSSLMNVLLMAWMARRGIGRPGVGEDRQDRRDERRDPVLVAVDPTDDPDGRPVGGDEAGRRRRRERIGELAEGRRLGAVELGAGRRSAP